MQLYHEYYKLGASVTYQVIYIDPLNLVIEESFGEEGYVGKLIFQVSELLV